MANSGTVLEQQAESSTQLNNDNGPDTSLSSASFFKGAEPAVPQAKSEAAASPAIAPDESISHSAHAHRLSLAESIAQEHAAMRASGQEGSMLAAPSVGKLVKAPGLSTSNSTSGEVAQQQDGMSLLALGKKKAGLTGDREIDEIIQKHPELAQYVQKLIEARDEALKNAQAGQKDALGSKDNLLAKLDIIATLLEGAPLAPQLRMGDLSVKDAFVALLKSESGDPEFAVAAEYVWDKARANMLEKEHSLDRNVALDILQKAEDIGRRRGELLARPTEPNQTELRQLDDERERVRQSLIEHFGPHSPMLEQMRISSQRAEDKARATIVAERAWELQYRLEISRGRTGERAAQEALDSYLRRQSDLSDRQPAFNKSLREHMQDATKAAIKLRHECDDAARSLFRAMDGCGTWEEDVYAALKNKSQLELQIIRERYKEQFNEELSDALWGDFDGADYRYVMSLYRGDPNKTGWEIHGLAADKMAAAFVAVDKGKEVDALLSGERGKVAATLMEGSLQTSQYIAADVARIIETTKASAAEVKAAQQELQTRDVVTALEQRAELVSSSGGNQVAVQVEKAGLVIAQATLQGQGPTLDQVVDYARLVSVDYGLNLGHAESAENPSQVQLAALEQHYEVATKSFTNLYAEYPGLRENFQLAVEQVRVNSYQAGVNAVMHKYGYELGLSVGREEANAANKKEMEAKLVAYQTLHKDFLDKHENARASAEAALVSGKQDGVASMERVQKSADLLKQGIIGIGTNEDKSYSAVQGRTSREMALIREVYKAQTGETLELSVEGDFSHAERDKMYALVDFDKVGELAADAQISLSAFWGPNNKDLRDTLSKLSSDEERAQFKAYFDTRYAQDFHLDSGGRESGGTQIATSFEQALSFKLSGDSLLIAEALYEGNQAKADAGIVHEKIDGTFSWHYAEGAKYLDGLRLADGGLDLDRVKNAAGEYSRIYKTDLRAIDTQDKDTDARWIAASARGEDVVAGGLRIQYGIEEEDVSLLKETLRVPEQLERQIWHDQAQLGGVSEATQAQLDAFIALRQSKIEQYNNSKPNKESSIYADISGFCNKHETRILSSLIQNGYLTRADVIADSCEGVGTRLEAIRAATTGLTKTQIVQLKGEFKDKEYGDLIEVLEGDLSGDDHFDIVTINLRGIPETREEMRELVKLRYEHETSGILVSDGVGAQATAIAVPVVGIARFGLGFWWKEERERLDKDYQAAMAALSSDGPLGGDDALRTDALYRRFCGSSDNFRAEKNHVTEVVTNTGTIVIMVGTTAVMMVGSGGTATPAAIAMWSLVGGAGAGTFRIGANYAIRGDGYGREEFGRDAAVLIADVALMKVPVGRLLGKQIELAAGEALVGQAAHGLAANGTRLAQAEVFSSAVQASRVARMSVGAIQGSVDAAIMAPIQTAVATGLTESTWQDGVGKGFLRIGEASLASIPMAMSVGAMAGATVRFRTPLAIKEGRVLSSEKAEAVAVSNEMGAEGRALLAQREMSKGFVTQGDVVEATLASKPLGKDESLRILESMRNAPEGRFTQNDIQIVEARLAQRGHLTQLDAAIVGAQRLPQGITVLTPERLQSMITEARAQAARLQARVELAGNQATPEMVAASNQAQARVDALSNIQSGGSALDPSRFVGKVEVKPAKTEASDTPSSDKVKEELLNSDSPQARRARQQIAEAEAEVRDVEAQIKENADNIEALEFYQEKLAAKRSRLSELVKQSHADLHAKPKVEQVVQEAPSDSTSAQPRRAGRGAETQEPAQRDVRDYLDDSDLSADLSADIKKAHKAVENYEGLLKKGGHSKGAQSIIEEELAKQRAQLEKLMGKADAERLVLAEHDKAWADFKPEADGDGGGFDGGFGGGGGGGGAGRRGAPQSGGAGGRTYSNGGSASSSYGSGRRSQPMLSDAPAGTGPQARAQMRAGEAQGTAVLDEPELMPEIEFRPEIEVAPARVAPKPAVKPSRAPKTAPLPEPIPEVLPPKPADATPASPSIKFANRPVQMQPELLPARASAALADASAEAARELAPQPRLQPKPQPFKEPEPKSLEEAQRKTPPPPKMEFGEGAGKRTEDEVHKLKLAEKRKEEVLKEKKKIEKPVHRGGHKKTTVHVSDSLGESDQEIDEGGA